MKTIKKVLDSLASNDTIDALAAEKDGKTVYGHRQYSMTVKDSDILTMREELEDLGFDIAAIEAALETAEKAPKSDTRDGFIAGLKFSLSQFGTIKTDVETKQ